MEFNGSLHLYCPIRGELPASKRSLDKLTSTEEYRRIEAIKYLIKLGYEAQYFLIEPVIKRFGNAGRNSFRSDFAVLDVPVSELEAKDPDSVLAHAVLICEVKRDNKKYQKVLTTQVQPMLDFAKRKNVIGLYWDNVEQRVFWTVDLEESREIKEGPLSFLPHCGRSFEIQPLSFSSIRPPESLISVFVRIEDILHQSSFSPEKRYEIIMQLLLSKIFDEHAHEGQPEAALSLQDFEALGFNSKLAKDKFSRLVERAIDYYEKHLPKKISRKVEMSEDTLQQILKILAPVKIIGAKRNVVQTFYMKFAKDFYKWDLAQYFTPTTITDFIIDVINPKFGEHICDPACGSADFLVAAFRKLREYNPGHADCVWGFDNSDNAVQVAVLNMVLNGDGKTNVVKQDSLDNVKNNANRFNVVTCNPPFGTKIVERRPAILKQFDLGFEWIQKNGSWIINDKALLQSQEMGILFIETCVALCKPGDRIAIILPNGYLGNKSSKYHILRQWLLKHTRIAAIVAFPRFSFKTSGADVSASVLFLEKRHAELVSFDDENYPIAIEVIEKVGWDAGNKTAKPVFERNADDGGILIVNGEPVLDCDFPNALHRIRNSNAANVFPWLIDNEDFVSDHSGWTVPARMVYQDEYLTIDPKRLTKKFVILKNQLCKMPHKLLSEMVVFLADNLSSTGNRQKRSASKRYGYIELSKMSQGEYQVDYYKGWELPDRAKHYAEPGDIYFGSIWGSAIKWCVIAKNTKDVYVTNGCFRCRMKPGYENYLTDLLAYMNSEGWGIQMRAMARGSDGLAEISETDAAQTIIPLLDSKTRETLQPYVDNLMNGHTTLNTTVEALIRDGLYQDPPKRPNHMALV